MRCFRPIVIAAALTLTAHTSAAQNTRSTRDGVFTHEQAVAGKDIYLGFCQSCHTAISHTGAPFKEHWVGKPLSDLYNYIITLMPKSAPGTLEPEQANIVLAYILKLNGMPEGNEPLPADAAPLKQIRIELTASHAGPPHDR